MANEQVYLSQDVIPDNCCFMHQKSTIYSCPLHWHNYIEIEIVLKGIATHIHNGVESKIKRGHISVFRINDYHEIKGTDDFEVLNLRIRDTALYEKTLTSLNSTQSNLSFDLDDDTFNTVLLFCNAAIKENSYVKRNDDYIKNLLDCIFILVLRNVSKTAKPVKKQNSDQLNVAVNYMHNHFRENPSLNAIAKIAHYSPTHFSHVFHQKIGRSYSDYLNDLKISYAKQLLTTTNLKVIDAGYQSGFNSYNNFYSTFKSYVGISPADYKKEKKSNTSPKGYSWRFGIPYTNIETEPAYVYIDTDVLEPETEYVFSYCFSYDYIIAFDRVQHGTTKQSINIINQNITDLNDRRRTFKVEITFKTRSKSPYRFVLKMGKGLNNRNCKYRYALLHCLSLLRVDEPDNENNPAAAYTHASGNVTWTENADAHTLHIDAKE